MASPSLPQINEAVYEFYRNRPVIITGASGFLGQKVVQTLDALKADVYKVSSKDVDLRKEVETERYFWEEFVAQEDIDPSQIVLFHFAANVSGIHDTAATPLAHLQDNLLMAINVMKNVQLVGIRNVVFAGSVCAYPERAPCPMVEANLWEGKPEPTNFSYGESKRVSMALLDAYYQQRIIDNYSILISANLYGPGDHFDSAVSHVIPALIMKIDDAITMDHDYIEIWGSGRASRDFLYVEDAAKAYVLAGYHTCQKREPIVVNIGSGQEVTIAALAKQLSSIMSFRGGEMYDTTKPDGQKRRLVSIYQAISELGWRPSTELEQGLRRTILWYNQYVKPIRDRERRYPFCA